MSSVASPKASPNVRSCAASSATSPARSSPCSPDQHALDKHESVHGSQYTSLAYGAYAKGSGIDLSMGSIGDPWDNAVAEAFFVSLEKELLRREHFPGREQARMRIFWYIECFYNTRRRHSGLGYLSPADYETHHQQEAIPA